MERFDVRGQRGAEPRRFGFAGTELDQVRKVEGGATVHLIRVTGGTANHRMGVAANEAMEGSERLCAVGRR